MGAIMEIIVSFLVSNIWRFFFVIWKFKSIRRLVVNVLVDDEYFVGGTLRFSFHLFIYWNADSDLMVVCYDR